MKVPVRGSRRSGVTWKRFQMPVGYRAHDVTGSGIFLGAALDGL